MMQRVLVADLNPPPEPMSVGNYNVFQGIVVNRYPVKDPQTGVVHRFSNRTDARPSTLVIHHMSIIG